MTRPMTMGMAKEQDRHGQRSEAVAAVEVATPGKHVLPGLGDAADGGQGSPGPAGSSPAAAYPGKGKSAGKITVQTAPAPGNPSTERTKIGVGEEVTFIGPSDGSWKLDGQDIGRGKELKWTAPGTMAVRNLVFDVAENAADRGAQSSLPIFIHAPTTVDFKKVGDMPVAGPDSAGVGMILQVDIGPKDVSFGAAEWLEGPGPAEGVSGYFAEYVKTGQNLAHKPNPAWLKIGASNDEIRDNVWTKDKPRLKHADGTMRWWAGAFQWTIPNYYRVAGGPQTLIKYVTQRFEMDDTGAITVTKEGASATARPANAGTGDLVKFKTVGEAKAWLQLHGATGAIQQAQNYKRNPQADPASVQLLISALTSFNLSLYTYVTCKSTYSWLGPDEVKVTANGKTTTGRGKLDAGQGSPYEFLANNVTTMAAVVDGAPIQLALVADGKTHGVALTSPYSIKDQALGEKYTISAYFK